MLSEKGSRSGYEPSRSRVAIARAMNRSQKRSSGVLYMYCARCCISSTRPAKFVTEIYELLISLLFVTGDIHHKHGRTSNRHHRGHPRRHPGLPRRRVPLRRLRGPQRHQVHRPRPVPAVRLPHPVQDPHQAPHPVRGSVEPSSASGRLHVPDQIGGGSGWI